jgi:hypothetical protein
MVGLPRKPIKNEGCDEEEHGMEREEEMKKGSSRDESSRKQSA